MNCDHCCWHGVGAGADSFFYLIMLIFLIFDIYIDSNNQSEVMTIGISPVNKSSLKRTYRNEFINSESLNSYKMDAA